MGVLRLRRGNDGNEGKAVVRNRAAILKVEGLLINPDQGPDQAMLLITLFGVRVDW
jgi:hypothetical protein